MGSFIECFIGESHTGVRFSSMSRMAYINHLLWRVAYRKRAFFLQARHNPVIADIKKKFLVSESISGVNKRYLIRNML